MPGVALSTRYRFAAFADAEAAIAAGMKPAPFDLNKPPKNWVDLNPAADEDGLVAYDAVLVVDATTGTVAHNTNGKPFTRKMTITADEAKTLNIWPHALALVSHGQYKPARQVPLDIDLATEMLDWRGYDNPIQTNLRGTSTADVVVRPIAEVPPATPVPFTSRDHALLEAIAASLGVS